MFYYFVPRCDVTGTMTLDGAHLPIDMGTGWYDHEFGGTGEEGQGPTTSGLFWNWIAAQLESGWEVSAFEIVDDADGALLHPTPELRRGTLTRLRSG
jgi:predicted secreted hydrolase